MSATVNEPKQSTVEGTNVYSVNPTPPPAESPMNKPTLREKVAGIILRNLNTALKSDGSFDKEVIEPIIAAVREEIEEAKPKKYGEVNTFSEIIENIDGLRQGISDYHASLKRRLE